jgi:hypothetical protein
MAERTGRRKPPVRGARKKAMPSGREQPAAEANPHFIGRHMPVKFNRLQQTATPPWVSSDQDQPQQTQDVQHRRQTAALLSSHVEPVPVAVAAEDQQTSPLTIFPTVYPQDVSGGAVIVQNHITVNVHSIEFRQFDAKLDEVIKLLRGSNEIAGEARDKMIAEMKAGLAILEGPKPDPKLIELFLKRPLIFLAKHAAGTVIGVAATAALAMLGKMTGLW